MSELDEKVNQNKKNPQSYQKINSKLYLKKNAPNNSDLNDKNPNFESTQTNSDSNTNINNPSNVPNNKFPRSRPTNIKFNIGKVVKIF